MGKSEYEELHTNNVAKRTNINSYAPVIQEICKSPSIMNDNDVANTNCNFEILENQVAGHMNDGRNLSMLVCGNKIYKPITKKECGERETNFYKGLNNPDYGKILKEFVPIYYGNEFVPIENKIVECITLEHLTKNFKEPCIMDIKIGKRTWDPLASPHKIKKEEEKYKETKRSLGFCITGFQYYDIKTEKLVKFHKDFGKSLNKDNIKDVLKCYLNGEKRLCRILIVQFLVILWQIQNWFRKQTKLHFYSSSLLLVYDARKLRNAFEDGNELRTKSSLKKLSRSNSLYRPLSIATLNGNDKISIGFSGQLTSDGPNLENLPSPKPFNDFPDNKNENKRKKSIPTLKRMHSHQNNYDNDLINMKKEYTYILDELISENNSELWVDVKMIDFAHTFPAENNSIDENYLKGINNLIKLFEEFLEEAVVY